MKSWVSKFLVVGVIILLIISACTKSVQKEDAKGRLEEYISKSFNVRGAEDKNILNTYLTGKAKAYFSGWSDQQFIDAFIESKRKFIALVIKENKKISEHEASITYELSYFEQNKGHDARITNKKVAQLALENDKWMIAEVKSVKELIEYKNEMTLP